MFSPFTLIVPPFFITLIEAPEPRKVPPSATFEVRVTLFAVPKSPAIIIFPVKEEPSKFAPNMALDAVANFKFPAPEVVPLKLISVVVLFDLNVISSLTVKPVSYTHLRAHET